MTLKLRACCECGEHYQPRRIDEEFCSTPCRKNFHNRRAIRGAEIYDLFMIMRYERGAAKALGIWNLMCRLALYWREEDRVKWNNRKSWRRPALATESSARGRATVVGYDQTGTGTRQR